MRHLLLTLGVCVVIAVGGWTLLGTDHSIGDEVRTRLGLGDASQLTLNFFDVGQGDATLIQLPGGGDILVDGGPDATVVKKLGQTLPFYDRTIEVMVLTHAHSDHLVGLLEVLERYHVSKVLMPEATHTTADYRQWLELLDARGIPVEFVTSTRIIALSPTVSMDILAPERSFADAPVENLNNTSIVFKLRYHEATAFFTGDFEDEESLVPRGQELASQVLKVGHHGSSNANNIEFLEAVRPTYAVISAGRDNQFGHPHYRTLYNLEHVGARALRTDQLGDIRLTTDGYQWQLR